MKEIRSIIVDDEPLARRLLRSMLRDHPDIAVVGEFGDGDSALEGVRELDPDLIFLDVQMPSKTGLELLEALGGSRSPEIIFVTAFDQYALRAFEHAALDYLLKPFDEERLSEALTRARARIHTEDGGGSDRVLALLEQLAARDRFIDRIPVRQGEKTILQPVEEVEWFESEGKYVRIHVGGEARTIRETMIRLEQQLDPRLFIRISRSAIINIRFIREVHSWFHGDYAVILKSGEQVNSTRTYRGALKQLLERG